MIDADFAELDRLCREGNPASQHVFSLMRVIMGDQKAAEYVAELPIVAE